VLLMFLTLPLIAQGHTTGGITGTVLNESTKQPQEFVNVVVLKATDSTLVTGAVTDGKGKIQITNVPVGSYFLKFSLLGFEEKKSVTFNIDPDRKDFNAGTIFLKESSVNLGEVTVTAQKSLYNSAIDRKVYNVQQDVASKTGSVSDLLQNVPSVQVDVDGTVSLRGSPDVQVLINGKPSPLLGNNIADALQQIPASSVEKIEVITNPSAKFTPEGTAGIINIVLKKDANLGFNGSVTANAGNNSRYNFSTSDNYNTGNVNFFGSYSLRQDERNVVNTLYREQIDSTNTPNYFTENERAVSRPLSQFATLGLEWRLTEKDNAGASGNYRYRYYTSSDITAETHFDSAESVVDDYDRRRVDFDQNGSSGVAGFYEHDFDGEDHKLRVEFNGNQMFDQEDNRFTNVYRLPAGLIENDNTLIQEHDRRGFLSVDYHYVLADHSIFDAGYQGRFDKDDFKFYASTFDTPKGVFVEDTGETNTFSYHEAIHSLYATYQASFGLFSVLGGLRGEEALITSDLLTNGTVVPNDYFKLYPTLHLAYKLGEFDELQLNYSLRANRPRGNDMNPFPQYSDPRNVSAGNPYLKPEFINSVEFGVQVQDENITILPSVFYRNRYNKFTSVTEALNDSTVLTTRENLSTDQSGGVEFVLTGSVLSFLSVNASTDVFYEEIDATNLGYGVKKSAISWTGNLNCSVSIVKGTTVQVNSNYRSRQLTPQGENLSSFVTNLGLRQDLSDERISIVATVWDIFRTFNRKTELNTPSLIQNSYNVRDSRVAFLGLTYHFGGPPKKSKDKGLELDEEN
jgi:outer membrane receptor protein involved in Fe transport